MNDECVKCLLRSDQVIKPDEIPLMTKYIPFRLVRAIGEMPCCLFERTLESLNGIIAYVNIPGFTEIVSAQAEQQKNSTDFSDILRSYFTRIIDTIRSMGGSIFQISGASLLICFERLYGESESENWRRALVAMDLVQSRSNTYNLDNSEKNGFSLDPGVGIGIGPFFQILLGQRGHYVTPVLAGPAVDEAVAAQKLCTGRDLIIGARAWNFAVKEGMENCFIPRNSAWLMESLPHDFIKSVQMPHWCDENELFRNPRYYNRIHAFINPIIQHKLHSRFKDTTADYKEVSTVLIRFEGHFVQSSDDFSLVEGNSNLNTLYELVVEKASRYGGFCLKPEIADKGTIFTVLFGAPSVLEFKERNAVLFADEVLAIQQRYQFLVSVCIGIATGQLFCGEYGSENRREYSAAGIALDFASRLIQSRERNALYLDEITHSKTEKLCETETFKTIYVQGFSSERSIYKFRFLKQLKRRLRKSVGLVGRDKELAQLNEASQCSLAGSVQIFPVVGDAGMGKSYLISSFLQNLDHNDRKFRVFYGNCYQYEESSLFFPWKQVLLDLFSIEEGMQGDLVYDRIHALFSAYCDPDDVQWIPYAMNMLGFSYDESDAVREISDALKQDHFFSLIHRILIGLAKYDPLLIVLEDIQWCDAVSLKMLEFIINGSQDAALFIIPISREADSILSFYQRLSLPYLHLSSLMPEHAAQLASLLMNMKESPETLVDKIVSTSDCNPFFLENIIQNMIESGVLVEDADGSHFLSKDIDTITIPSSIQNIILSRLNSLVFEEQVVFKTAAVIGRCFMTDILRALVPDGITEHTFYSALENFESHNLILQEDERRSTYYFKHITIRDVVYNTIMESTRKELNLMLLSYLESRYAENISTVVERLEYHAMEAEAWPKLVQYAQLSAEKSEKQFANQDAVFHYQNALKALTMLENGTNAAKINEITLLIANAYRRNSQYQQAQSLYRNLLESEQRPWYRSAILKGIGQSYQEQGDLEKAVSALEEALYYLGDKPPKSSFAIYSSIAKEALVQLLVFLFRGNKVKEYSGDRFDNTLMRSEILYILSRLYYFGRTEKIAWSGIRSYNLTLHIQNKSDPWIISLSNYALALVSAGFTSLGLYHFSNAQHIVHKSKSRIANNIYKARYASYFLFYNQPHKSIELLEEAANNFRGIGEMWELMTALGALGQNQFLISELEESEKAYLETEVIARKLHSLMHIGWAYNKVPFIRYLQGRIDAEEAIGMLKEGIGISQSVYDHMTLCIHYGHLAYIAEKEADVVAAVRYAREILRENSLYASNLPHVKISYVNAADAFCYALENKSPAFKRSRLRYLAKKAIRKAGKQGKKFVVIRGPAYRAASRLALLEGKNKKARLLCHKALLSLHDSPYAWEYAIALKFAAEVFPEERLVFLEKANIIFEKKGIIPR